MDKSDVLLYYEFDNSGTVDFWRKGLDGEWLYEGCIRQVRKITANISTQQTIFRAKGNSLVLQSVAPKPEEEIKRPNNRSIMFKKTAFSGSDSINRSTQSREGSVTNNRSD